MKQHEEFLCDDFLALTHRVRHVHHAEHDRLGDGLRLFDEIVVPKVHVVEIGDRHGLGAQRGDLVFEFRDTLGRGHSCKMQRTRGVRVCVSRIFSTKLGKLGFKLVDALQLRRLQCDAPGHTSHGRALDVDVRRVAAGRVAHATVDEGDRIAFGLLDQVGEFQIVEDDVQILFVGEDELEFVFSIAVAFTTPAATTALRFLRRLLDDVADDVFRVAGQDVIVFAGARIVPERGFVDAVARDGDIDLALVVDRLRRESFLGRLSDGFLCAINEPLPIGEAFLLRVLSTVDDDETVRHYAYPPVLRCSM